MSNPELKVHGATVILNALCQANLEYVQTLAEAKAFYMGSIMGHLFEDKDEDLFIDIVGGHLEDWCKQHGFEMFDMAEVAAGCTTRADQLLGREKPAS